MGTPTNPLARDPQALDLFRSRVERGDWRAARRLGLALQLHRVAPQQIFEDDAAYLRRLADAYAAPAPPRHARRAS
ncbi:MAG TPA: hypothetical protein VIJ48_08755 [Acidimicrobiia bacterium]|jgi:hypothetical protein